MKTVLFDLDNTLTHRNHSISKFSNLFLAVFKHRLLNVTKSDILPVIFEADNGGYLRPDSRFQLIKDSVSHALFDNLQWYKPPSVRELRDFWIENMPKSSVTMDGVPGILLELKKLSYSIGVVSNGADRSRKAIVKALNIGHAIDFLLSSEQAGIKKPDPKIFNMAIDQIGAMPSETWFVGDHPIIDVMGAQRVGFKSVWLSGFHAWPNEYPEPEYSITALSELLNLVS